MYIENLAPIVVFTYNRLWHTKQTIEALQKNDLAEESELYIFSDGPKNKDSSNEVNDVREYIKKIDGFKKITIIERDKNWGLARSIIDGVSTVVNEHGKLIVLEDDLVTSPHFLSFMNANLSLYKDNQKVGSISGYIPHIKNLPDLFFLKFGTSLGWGTWKRVWNTCEFDENILLSKFDNKNKIYEFSMDGAYNYYKMLNSQKNKQIDSWAIRFVASLFLQNLLSLRVGKSLIQHIGSDSGTHCNTNIRTSFEDGIISYIPIKDFVIDVEEDVQSYELFKNFHKKSVFTKINIKIRRILKDYL